MEATIIVKALVLFIVGLIAVGFGLAKLWAMEEVERVRKLKLDWIDVMYERVGY